MQPQAHLADGRHADVAQIQGIDGFQFHPLLEPTAFCVDSSNLRETRQLGNMGRPRGGGREAASSAIGLGKKQGEPGPKAWKGPAAKGESAVGLHLTFLNKYGTASQ